MDRQATIAPVTVSQELAVSDLIASLAAGFRDFCRFPQFGLFFSLVYVLAGLFLTYALYAWGQATWMIPVAAGFPIIAPFTAVGLYEVSRRREAGLPVSWRAVLGALRGNGDDQLLMMGGILFVAFSFWMILAHGIFAIFMAESGIGHDTLALFTTGTGIAMLIVGSLVGAAVALAFYAITVISLPILVDCEVDFLTAIIVSLGAMRSNGLVLLIWAFTIAVLLVIAMLPAFLGLFVALPVLGHATWHLYRRAVGQAAA